MFAAQYCMATTITNLPAVPGTTYYWTNIAPLININYATQAATDNAQNATNTVQDARMTSIEGVISGMATNSGTLYVSNTWNLVSITNGMANGSIKTVNSNGATLVDVWMSNSIPVLKPRW